MYNSPVSDLSEIYCKGVTYKQTFYGQSRFHHVAMTKRALRTSTDVVSVDQLRHLARTRSYDISLTFTVTDWQMVQGCMGLRKNKKCKKQTKNTLQRSESPFGKEKQKTNPSPH